MTYSKKWGTRYTTRGARTSSSKPFLASTIRTAIYERRDFELDDIRHMVHTTYVNNLSRSFNSKPVAGCGIAMQVVGDNNSEVK